MPAARSTPSPATPDAAGDRLLRWPDVHERTGLSRTTVWRLVRGGAFLTPRRLSANAVAWLASEVDAWIASRAPTTAVHHPKQRDDGGLQT